MKRLIRSMMILLILCGCSTKEKVDKAFVFTTTNTLEKQDAQDAYEFFERTVETGTREATSEDVYSGGYQIPVFFEIDHKEKSFQFQLEYMIVVDDSNQIIGKYVIEDDYYKNEFYPYISRLFDKYGPTFVQVTNSKNGVKITLESPEGKRELPLFDVMDLFDLTQYIGTKYSVSEEYHGSLYNPRYILEIDDGVVKETVYFINNYAIINNRRIELPASIDLDTLLAEKDYNE